MSKRIVFAAALSTFILSGCFDSSPTTAKLNFSNTISSKKLKNKIEPLNLSLEIGYITNNQIKELNRIMELSKFLSNHNAGVLINIEKLESLSNGSEFTSLAEDYNKKHAKLDDSWNLAIENFDNKLNKAKKSLRETIALIEDEKIKYQEYIKPAKTAWRASITAENEINKEYSENKKMFQTISNQFIIDNEIQISVYRYNKSPVQFHSKKARGNSCKHRYDYLQQTSIIDGIKFCQSLGFERKFTNAVNDMVLLNELVQDIKPYFINHYKLDQEHLFAYNEMKRLNKELSQAEKKAGFKFRNVHGGDFKIEGLQLKINDLDRKHQFNISDKGKIKFYSTQLQSEYNKFKAIIDKDTSNRVNDFYSNISFKEQPFPSISDEFNLDLTSNDWALISIKDTDNTLKSPLSIMADVSMDLRNREIEGPSVLNATDFKFTTIKELLLSKANNL